MILRAPILLGAVVLQIAGAAVAASEIRTERIRFEPGASSAVVEASIKGYESVDYVLGAASGQHMNVGMTTNNAANYFNILAPGESEVAIFNGSVAGNRYDGTLSVSGDYTVRVYLMRSAARRGESAKYALSVRIAGSGSPAPDLGTPPPGDAKVPGTPYHATSQVACSMGDAPANSSHCDVGVVRGKPGNAEVHLTPPGGFERVLRFIGDHVTSEGAAVTTSKSGDSWTIDVNDYEHYQIPEALISGG